MQSAKAIPFRFSLTGRVIQIFTLVSVAIFRPIGILHFVPHLIPCPQCNTAGFVRREYVIQAALTKQVLYCGHCEFTWEIRDGVFLEPDAPKPSVPYPKPRTHSIRGGRPPNTN
jgi:uncharacterized protein YbaR (Trm112 family)